MSQTVEIDYLLNLKLANEMDYSDLRRLEMSFVKVSNIIQRVFPNSDAAKIMKQANSIINAMHSVQVAIRQAQQAYQMYELYKAGISAFDPVLAATTAISVGYSMLNVYEQTVGNY